MGDKLVKMVKYSFLVISLFFLNLNADLDKSTVRLISYENISVTKDAKIYEVSASFNNMVLKSARTGKPNKNFLKKFSTISKKDRYAIQVLNEMGNQVMLLGLGNPFYIHADHIGYEHSHDFGGYIDQNLEIAIPLTINAAQLVLLSQDEFGFKQVSNINLK
jgi:hypothetical protein